MAKAKATKDAAREVPARDARGRFVRALPSGLAISVSQSGKSKGRLQAVEPSSRYWTAKKRATFLETLSETANLAAALAEVKMSRPGLQQLRKREPDFERQLEAALEEAYARLELALLERAKFGVEQPVFYQGEQVGATMQYPNTMGMSLLRHHRAIAASVRARRVDPAVADADRDAVFVALRARIELAKARRTGEASNP